MPSPAENVPSDDLIPLPSERAGTGTFLPLLRTYVAGLALLEKQIEVALEAQASGDLREVLHRLKGSGDGYGYPEISRVAGSCESALLAAGRGGTQDPGVLAGLSELKNLFARARLAVERSAEGLS